MKWNIGNVEIKNQIVLAPMAGLSTPSYMKICEEMGVGYVVTELISAEAIVRNSKKTFAMLKGIEELSIPVAVQIFGSNPDTMAKAAKILTGLYKNQLIDINMGCPVPKVALKSQAGSALLKNPEKIYQIVKAVVEAVDVPVTVKIRSGWDEFSINAVEVAKVIEEAGASAITIHARTRSQGYSGVANWDIIKKVKEAVFIPVIGNGDVTSALKAKEMLLYTQCDAVMLGRGCLGNPWLISECVHYLETGEVLKEVSVHEKIQMMKRHLDLLIRDKGEKIALLEIKSNYMYYLKHMPHSKETKTKVCSANSYEELISLLDCYEASLEKEI